MKIEINKLVSGGRGVRPLTKIEGGGDGKERWAIFEDEKGVQFKIHVTLSDAETVHGMPWMQ